MFKLFKNSFFKTNDCIILATPLIIFLSIIGWYANYAKVSVDTIGKLIISIITLFVIISGFSAAWLYMAKKTLKLSSKVFLFDKNRAKEMFNLICQLPKGIGRMFFPILGVLMTFTLFYAVFFIIINYFISKYITPIDLSTLGISYSFMTSDEIFYEIMDLPQKELIALNCWYMLTFFISVVCAFFTMLWIPEIVYGEKNPFKALIYSIKNIFSDIKNYVLLFSFIIVLYISTCLINTILMINPILYFIVLLISYYFILYVVVLLFSYYEFKFIEA